tara:strand:+ start:312 stop:521 length:210 start_codon:yes stop_codon:yes gene_type:complete
LEYRFKTKRDNQSSSEAKGSGSWEKIWEISSIFDLVANKRNQIWRKAMDNYTNLQARKGNHLEVNATTV